MSEEKVRTIVNKNCFGVDHTNGEFYNTIFGFISMINHGTPNIV